MWDNSWLSFENLKSSRASVADPASGDWRGGAKKHEIYAAEYMARFANLLWHLQLINIHATWCNSEQFSNIHAT